jgi:hypothetical protein
MSTDREVGQRLYKTYGITLLQYEEMFRDQGGGCKICGRPPATRRLHVDHDHKIRYLKVDSHKIGPGAWVASCGTIFATGRSKSEVVRKVRNDLKPLSIRGLVCFRCNAGLEKFSDNPKNLAAASEYIARYEATKEAYSINAPTGA